MARYIDADKFIERLKASPAFPNMGMDGYFLLDVVENLLKKFPTADVAPKSEVEKIQEAYNNRLAKDIQTNADFVKYAKAEVAREIFEEIESKKMFVRDRIGNMRAVVLFEDIAELKKKYTGVENGT